MSSRHAPRVLAAGIASLLCLSAAPAFASAPVSPVTMSVPRAVTVYANAGTGAVARFRVTARDTVGNGLRVSCSRASGSEFPLGRTVVTCTAKSTAGQSGTASFPVTVALRGGRFAAPLVVGGLVQKGDQVHSSFRLYGSDGLTGLSDTFAASLDTPGRVVLHVQQLGAKVATTQPVAYSVTTHRFWATVQTFAWAGGANYRVWYTVTTAGGTLIAGRGVVVGVRLGA